MTNNNYCEEEDGCIPVQLHSFWPNDGFICVEEVKENDGE